MKKVAVLLPILDYNETNLSCLRMMLDNFYWMQDDNSVQIVFTGYVNQFKRPILDWVRSYSLTFLEVKTSVEAIKEADVVLVWYDNSHMSNYYVKKCEEMLVRCKLATEILFKTVSLEEAEASNAV